MKNFGIALLALCLIAPATSVLATQDAPVDAPVDTITVRVTDPKMMAPGLSWGNEPLSSADLRDRGGDNLAENLDQLPGVAAVRRAASAAEIVIRGMGWERVQTVLGAVPLYGACPGRMDPPATYLTALSTEEVTVFRQGGGAGGPGGTGGAIMANPDYERQPGAETGVTPWLGMGYESAREGVRFEGGLFGGSEAVDYKFGVGHRKYEDYTAPDGTLVPAGATTTTAAGSVGWRPSANQRLWYAATYALEKDIDFPSMPMDNIETDFWVHNVGWRTTRDEGLMRKFELTGGLSTVDHLMDNSMKPNRGMMEAATDADTRSAAGHAIFTLVPNEKSTLTTGLDLTRLKRDATRTRVMLPSRMTYQDRLWPDAVQTSIGGFANLDRQVGELTLSLNGRLDVIDSEARAADAASLGGLTVREQYVNYYGAEAAETDLSETLGQLDLGLSGEFRPDHFWYARAGLSTRAAGISERYYAFGPAPGGYQVGNPTLNAEHKMEGEVGITVTGEHMTFAASGYHAKVTDFILQTVIDRRDVNGDSIDDTIKGFTNVDATLTGGEVGVEFHPSETFLVPVTVSYVRGKNTTDGRDLPEMPPLFGSAEVRWLAHDSSATWLRGGATFASSQENVDPLFPEDRTGGYTIWHLGLESQPVAGWQFGVLVDNLFDRLYSNHLTREAVLAVGGLMPGQEIPAPGRNVSLTARMEF